MYIQVDEDFPQHPKSVRLSAALGNPVGWAYMIKLWSWAAKYQHDGELGGYDAAEIEMAAGWAKADGKFYTAAARVGFIDEDEAGKPGRLHAWMERTGADIVRMEQQAKLSRDRKKAWRERKGNADGTRDIGVPDVGQDGDSNGTERVGDAGRTHIDKTSPGKARQDESSQASDQRRSCGETPAASSPPAEPPLLTFPCDGEEKQWHVTKPLVKRWRELFPSLDIGKECRSALAWVEANPTKRKTAGGMPKFLVGWFTRTQERGGRSTGRIPGAKSDGNMDVLRDWLESGAEAA